MTKSESKIMASITVKLEKKVKKDLLKFLKDKNLTVSEATRLFYVFLIEKNQFPSEIEKFLCEIETDLTSNFKMFLGKSK